MLGDRVLVKKEAARNKQLVLQENLLMSTIFLRLREQQFQQVPIDGVGFNYITSVFTHRLLELVAHGSEQALVLLAQFLEGHVLVLLLLLQNLVGRQ